MFKTVRDLLFGKDQAPVEIKTEDLTSLEKKGTTVLDSQGRTVDRNFFYLVGGVMPDMSWGGFQSDVQQGFGHNPDIFSVIDKIARSMQRVPVIVKRSRSEVEVRNTDLNRFVEDPNEYESREDFVYKAAAYLLACGNTFISPVKFEDRIVSFRIWHTPTVSIITSGAEDGPILSYSYDGKTYLPSEVLHIKYAPDVSKRTHWGASPLRPGAKLLSASNATFTASSALRENIGMQGIISSKDAQMPMTDDERKDMQEQLERNISGPSKVGKVYLSPTAVEFTSMALDAKMLDLEGARKWSVKDICKLYNVPPALFGEGEGLTYNGMPEAYAEFYQNVVAPRAEQFWREFGNFAAGLLGIDARVVPDFGGISAMQMSAEKQQAIERHAAAGIISAAEARRMLYPWLLPAEAPNQQAPNQPTQTNPQP